MASESAVAVWSIFHQLPLNFSTKVSLELLVREYSRVPVAHACILAAWEAEIRRIKV
jgi:hypothetical protein